MNKEFLGKIKVFATTILLLGNVVLLPGCSNKGEDKPITFSQIFYDNDDTGIDDTFEQKITNSGVEIAEVEKLETYIEYAEELNSILKGVDSRLFSDDDKTFVMQSTFYSEVGDIDLNNI